MISAEFAGNALLLLFGLLFIFHLLIIAGIIPDNIVWAGRIKSRQELIKMESVSLIVLSLATTLVAIRMGYINFPISKTVLKIGLWLLFAFFTLNTLGNFTAKSPIEKYGFGFLTIVIALLALSLALAT